MRPETSITGALSNAFENFSVSMVAEVIISFKFFLLSMRDFNNPNRKSILRLLSWASSTIIVSYALKVMSDRVSARRIPSVIILINWVLPVFSANLIL